MPYAPGPFFASATRPLSFQLTNYDFTSFAATELSDLDAIGYEIDSAMPDLVNLANDTTDPLDGLDIFIALSEMTTQQQIPLVLDQSSWPAYLAEGDALFAAAVASAPAEAWTEPPAPFIPPYVGDVIAAPVISPGAFEAPPPGTSTIPPATVPIAGRALALINATVYGSANFRVTDTWLIQAAGQPGEAVTVHAYVGGADIGAATVGNIGSDGRFELEGRFSPGDEGAWTEVWTVGGIQTATYNFIVSPS